MPREADTSDSGTPNENQTVNDQAPGTREISSLRNFRERETASSAARSSQGTEGDTSPNTGSDGSTQREQAIPRERFDQVNEQKNQFQQEAQQLRQQMQMMQQMAQLQGQQQPTGPVHNPGGMMGQAPQQTQQQQSSGINWDDPEVQEKWRKKLGNDPIQGMREFFQTMLQEEGAPMLEQVKQELLGQVEPVRNAYVQQTLGQYAQQRSQQDPSFQQIAPHFQQVVQSAIQQRPNLQLNQQTLPVLEQIARINAQQQAQQFGNFGQPQVGQFAGMQQGAQQQTAPFSERPQGQQPNRGTGNNRTFTQQERQVAKMFGKTPEEYFAKQERMKNG